MRQIIMCAAAAILAGGVRVEKAPKPVDPARKAARAARARAWNAAHPERKRANDRRWAAKYGAEATRRCRARRKAA